MLRLSFYNCRGFPKNRHALSLRMDLDSLFDKTDILCLQETWLFEQDLSCLNNVHVDFVGIGTSTFDLSRGLCSGHAPGGVAILYRQSLQSCIEPISFDVDWCVGAKVSIDGKSFYVINLYLPHQCVENEPEYLEKLGNLSSILEGVNLTSYILVGDWNANLGQTGQATFAEHMTEFCEEHSLVVSSKVLLPPDSFTYVSDSWATVSWLDHAVSSADMHSIISSIEIGYGIAQDDHMPVIMDLNLSKLPSLAVCDEVGISLVDWSRMNSHDLDLYRDATEYYLKELEIPRAVTCTDVNCKSLSHVHDIFDLYEGIVVCLSKAGQVISADSKKKGGQFSKTGWNQFVKEHYNRSREYFIAWKEAGKPRQGPIFEAHKEAKASCKRAIRYIKKHENELRREALGRKLTQLDTKGFWKEVKNMSGSQVPRPSMIEGVCGEGKIASLWGSHFEELFNSVPGSSDVQRGTDVKDSEHCHVTLKEVNDAIKELSGGKSCGADNISAEHLKYASGRLGPLLSLCFTASIIHGKLPEALMKVVLVPVIKNKAGSISSMNNYRPVALASVISKVYEIVLLNKLKPFLSTHDNQFGYKKGLGTDHCIYALKEVIEFYRSMNGNVHVCFLDASKGFDRINHRLLFDKLTRRGVPECLVRILSFWYSSQRMCVRWGSTYSTCFGVSNGVRQGGILSPYLFNVYMDKLSSLLNDCGTGCYIGERIVNHLMYADDLVVIAPSGVGLQRLLDVCGGFGLSHDVKYNASKSYVMCCRSRLLRDVRIPDFSIGGVPIAKVSVVKYLGHFITDDLTDDKDIARQNRVLFCQGNMILRKFHMCTVEVKLALFRAHCTSMYCSHLWWNFRKGSMTKFVTSYHNLLKRILGLSKFESTSASCAYFRVPSCEAVLRNMIYRFMMRVDRCSNDIMFSICLSSLRYRSNIRRSWIGRLYTHVDMGVT